MRIVRVWGKAEIRFRDLSSAKIRSELIFLILLRRDGSLLRWFAKSQATSPNWWPSRPCCFSISWPVVCLLWGRASIIASKQQIVVNFILYLVCVFDSFLICKTTFANYISLGTEPTGVLKSFILFPLDCFDEKMRKSRAPMCIAFILFHAHFFGLIEPSHQYMT